jgi:hypothetical protein
MSKRRNVSFSNGDIVKIPLPTEKFGYGCVLDRPLMGFYNFTNNGTIAIEYIARHPFMFKVFVEDNAIKSGRWTIVGKTPVVDNLRNKEKFFKKDPISNRFYIYIDSKLGVSEREVSPEECIGLEAAAVWSAEHVEERIIDELEGKQNRWAKILNNIDV